MRMQKAARGICFLLTLLAGMWGTSALRADPMQITWHIFDFPPFNFIEGPNKGKGLNDRQLALLRDHLTGYLHGQQITTIQDLIRDAVSGGQICGSALLKTPEREEILIFSDPIVRIYAPGLIYHPDKAETVDGFRDIQGVDLYGLIIQNPLIVGRHKGRRYGQQIDEVLSRLSDYFPDRIRISATDASATRTLMRLLDRGRIDVMFGYAHELKYLAGEIEATTAPAYAPIEGADRFVDVHAACPRTGWGKQVIDAINLVLEIPEIREQMAVFYAEWLDPETRREYMAGF